MRKYELLYIVDAKLSDEDKEKVISSVNALIESNGGTAGEPDRWGIRKYAYPINYTQEGFYVLVNFEANENVPSILNDKFRINKNIVRHMIVAK